MTKTLLVNDVELKLRIKDIFSDLDEQTFVVIPTNCGWQRNGENVMGAGLAKIAKNKFPELPVRYGGWCRQHGHTIYVDFFYRLICAPSKKLNASKPWMSWNSKADPEVVKLSYQQLAQLLQNKFFVDAGYKIRGVLLGTGNGEMSQQESANLLVSAGLNKEKKFELFTTQ